jgi:hypothetical protein
MTNILKHPPLPGEVWTVDDEQVRLHVDNRVMKGHPCVAILPNHPDRPETAK